MSNYVTTKESNSATGANTPNLVAKIDFIVEVGNLDVDKLKTVPKGLKKLSDVLNKEIAKTKVYNKLNTKSNS